MGVGFTEPARAIAGPPKLDASDNALLIVPLAAPLSDGKYTVDWQAVGKDGHKTKGSYSFTAMH